MQQHAEEPTSDHPPQFKSFAKEEHMNEAFNLHHRPVEVGNLHVMGSVLVCTWLHLKGCTAGCTAGAAAKVRDYMLMLCCWCCTCLLRGDPSP